MDYSIDDFIESNRISFEELAKLGISKEDLGIDRLLRFSSEVHYNYEGILIMTKDRISYWNAHRLKRMLDI